MNNIEKLIEGICDAEYDEEMYDKHYRKQKIVNQSSKRAEEKLKKAAIEEAVYGWVSTQIDDLDLTKKVAELEAKCYAYEKIIANSNFSPMIDKRRECNEDSD